MIVCAINKSVLTKFITKMGDFISKYRTLSQNQALRSENLQANSLKIKKKPSHVSRLLTGSLSLHSCAADAVVKGAGLVARS